MCVIQIHSIQGNTEEAPIREGVFQDLQGLASNKGANRVVKYCAIPPNRVVLTFFFASSSFSLQQRNHPTLPYSCNTSPLLN